MLRMRSCSRTIFHSAESTAILLACGRITWNAAITEPLGRLPGRIPHALGNRARRYVLAHVAPELIAEPLVRIGDARTMLRIVRPYAGAMRVADVSRIEIVLMDKRIIHNDCVATPSGMPAPAAPSMPAKPAVSSESIGRKR